MSREKAEQEPEGIEAVRARIERWRQNGRPGRAMPQELWSAAATLATRHGVYVVSQQLGLGFGKLKALVQQPVRAMALRPEARAAGFIELSASELPGAPAALSAGSVVLEWLEPDGRRLRLSASGAAALQVPTIVGALERRCQRCCS